MTTAFSLSDVLHPERVLLNLRVRDKAQLLKELARRVATPDIPAETIHTKLTAREALGSTGLGHGFALPHARLDGQRRFVGLFARLSRPIDYGAIDEMPVDLVFQLLLPGEDTTESGATIAALAKVARLFRDSATTAALRRAGSATEVMRLLGG
jgi:PTS system nitrogen regulatory IIA component